MSKFRAPEIVVQYLTWALEEIEHETAAHHIRLALQVMRTVQVKNSNGNADDAERFRNMADEAEQLADLAKDNLRRESLRKIAESYRLMANDAERDAKCLAGDSGAKRAHHYGPREHRK